MEHRKLAVMVLVLLTFSMLGSLETFPVKAAQTFPPTTGTTNEAVITVQFPASNLYLQSNKPYLTSLGGQVRYYQNASYGKLSINYTVYGPFNLPNTEAFYGDDSACGHIDCNKLQFIQDSLQYADQAGVINWNNYQHITIVHAGPGQESTHTPSDIYSSWVGFSPAYVTKSGVQISRVIVISETSPIGTFCHEFGHDNGLPDIYDLQGGSTDDFIGPWSLMAAGNWLGIPPGSSPGSFDSWSKTQLGWITPVTVSNATANVTIGALELPNQAVYAVKIPLTSTTYYLLESRLKVGVDTAIPSEGVLVLLVDTSKLGPPPTGVVLVEPHPNPDLNTAPLQPGQSFADPQNRVFIKVTGQAGSGYRVQITAHMLFVTLLGPLQVSVTQSVSYIVHVTDEQSNAKSGILVTLGLDGRTLQQVATDLVGNATLHVTFNWTDIGLHTLTVQTRAISNYIDGSQKAILQVVLPSSAYPIVAGAIIVPLGLVLLLRRRKHTELLPPSQWASSPAYTVATNFCSQCGRPVSQGAPNCMFCGARFA